MNFVPVIKKTSWGISDPDRRATVRARGYKRLKCSDPRKHIPYIDRYGTLQDENGTPIAKKKRIQELNKRLAMSVDPDRDIFCLSFSLPLHRTDEARSIVENYCREIFGTFLSAYHEYNKVYIFQPHVHVDVFNDISHHPLNRLAFIQQMKAEIGARYEAAGITFSEHKPRSPFEPTAAGLNAKRRREAEASMKAVFQCSLSSSLSIKDWTAALQREGLSIARETKDGIITLANAEGYRMRLENISDGKMKTRNELERYFYENKKEEERMDMKRYFEEEEREIEGLRLWEEAKMHEEIRKINEKEGWKNLAESEEVFSHNYARWAATLTAAGLSPEQIQKTLDPERQPLCDPDNLQGRWDALKTRREALEKGLSRDDLYALEKVAKEKNIDLSRCLNSLNPNALIAAGEGNPLPLLLGLSSFITPLLQASQAREKNKELLKKEIKELPPRGFKPSGIFPGAGEKEKDNTNNPGIAGPEMRR